MWNCYILNDLFKYIFLCCNTAIPTLHTTKCKYSLAKFLKDGIEKGTRSNKQDSLKLFTLVCVYIETIYLFSVINIMNLRYWQICICNHFYYVYLIHNSTELNIIEIKASTTVPNHSWNHYVNYFRYFRCQNISVKNNWRTCCLIMSIGYLCLSDLLDQGKNLKMQVSSYFHSSLSLFVYFLKSTNELIFKEFKLYKIVLVPFYSFEWRLKYLLWCNIS